MSLFSLKGKVCIVTGAGRGIGHQIAKSLSSEGAIVTGIDTTFEGNDYSFHKYCVDLTKIQELDEFCARFDKLDVLVNCAGVTIQSSPDYSLDDWQKTLNVNLTAPFLMINHLKQALKASNSSSIINVTSLNSKLAFPENPAYIASKAGLDGLTRSFALDLGNFGIRVNSIAPGYIKTNMTGDSWYNLKKRKKRQDRTMLDRWGTPKDISGPVCFLASDASSYVTGQTIYVDGGWSSKGF